MKRSLFVSLITLGLMFVPSTFASTCLSTTDCTFTFDEHNGGFSDITSTGPYGTVELLLQGDGSIKVSLDLLSNLVLIVTGFPGSFGYNSTLNDVTPFTAGSFSSVLYSGSANNGGVDTTGGSGSDLHFDGFGYFDDAAATTGPNAGNSSAVSNLTFVLSRTGGFTSVQQLIEDPSGGGDGAPYFVADVFDKTCGSQLGAAGACTGLIGVSNLTSPVPEPTTYVPVVGAALAAMVFVGRRRRTSAELVERS